MRAARRLAALFVVVAFGAASAAAQGNAGGPAFERPVTVAAPGPQKLAVDLPLLAASRRAGGRRTAPARQPLGDLRLVDGAGKELPYLVIDQPPPRPVWVSGPLTRIPETKRSSGFELDLLEPRSVDGLDILGLPAPFMKRVLLEGSGDRSHWNVLIGEGTVFDLPDEQVRRTLLTFAPGSYRYLRVTWDDSSSARVALPAQAAAREVQRVGAAGPLVAEVPFERQSSEPGRSRYRLRLPAPNLPIAAVIVAAGEGDVFRMARAIEPRFTGAQANPVEIGRTRFVRARDRYDPAAGDLRLPISPPQAAEIDLVIDDGSNPPLEVRRISVELAVRTWIYFESPAGPVTARYGDPSAAAPQYDLEARRAGIDVDVVPEARWGEPRRLVSTPDTATVPPSGRGAHLDAGGYRFRRQLPEQPLGLVALQLDADALARSAGPSRAFADVRVVDREGYQVPYLLERRDEPLSIDVTLAPTSGDLAERVRGSGNRSVYTIELPSEGLPPSRMVIETDERVFHRRVELAVERAADRAHRDAWIETLTGAAWQRAETAGSSAGRAALELPFTPGDVRRVLLIVDEGDNRPLPIAAARLLLPSWRLRFYRPEGPLQLLYGKADAIPPQYDLALLATTVLSADAPEMSPAAATVDGRAAETPLLSPRVFWIGLGAAALVLLGLIVRLISSSPPPPPSRPDP